MEETVLTSVFMRIRNRLQSLAASITGSREEAEDTLHDAFCKLWKAYPAVQDEEEAARLSYTVVRHTALDKKDKSLSHASVEVESISDSLPEENDDTPSDQEHLYNSLLVMAKRVLKEDQYSVFMMHDVDGLPYPEVADKLGLSQVNVRQLLSRARKRIREEYRKTNSLGKI